MENAIINSIMNKHCPACIIPTENLGANSRSGYLLHLQSEYIVANNISDRASLRANPIKHIKNTLSSILNVSPTDLIQADILYNVLLRVLDHLMKLMQGFCEHRDWINAYIYL